jgi:lipopolysaccharide/colanic/teichoic acid biosynthesis glycosyltransferase
MPYPSLLPGMLSLSADERKKQRVLLTSVLVGTDVVALVVALLVSHRIAASWSKWYAPADFPPSLWLAVPVAIALFALIRLYVLDDLLEGPIEYGRVIHGCTLASFSVIVLGFWGKALGELAPSRVLIALVWGLSIAMVGGGRFTARRIVRFLRRRGYFVSRAVIVGLGASGIGFARHFKQLQHTGIKVVGFVDDFLPTGTPVLDDLRVLGPPSALRSILGQTGASEVIIVPTAMAWESFQDLIRQVTSLDGHIIRLAPGSRDLLSTSMKAHQLGFIPMMTVERVRIVGLDRILKSVLDYGIALLVLSVAAPLMLLVAAALRASGVDPLRRVQFIGREGGVFTTAVLNTAGVHARVAVLARQLGVDRLLQLVSVLRGQMSIVGPRPIPADKRREHAAWLPGLLSVKPGLTGTWAIRQTSSLDEEMELSLFYIRNYTIWLDLEVLVRVALRLLTAGRAGQLREEAAPRERVAVHR